MNAKSATISRDGIRGCRRRQRRAPAQGRRCTSVGNGRPGWPVSAMISEGRLKGLVVAGGLIAGIRLQRAWALNRAADSPTRQSVAAAL